MSVFVDTGVWYASADRGDTHNADAKRLLSEGHALVTTDHVLVEMWYLLRARSDRATAEAFWDGLRRSVRLETVGEADLQTAWQIGERFPDHDFSIVDRTSFAVMVRLGITRAAAFDHHFAVFRYGARGNQAFEVLR